MSQKPGVEMNPSLGAHCETLMGGRGPQQTMALGFSSMSSVWGLDHLQWQREWECQTPQTIPSAAACWGPGPPGNLEHAHHFQLSSEEGWLFHTGRRSGFIS